MAKKSKKDEVKKEEGGGDSDVHSSHSTSMSMTEMVAAWAMANDKKAYAPLNSQDKVAGLSQVAHALNQELGMDISPSPFGGSHPDYSRDHNPPPKKPKEVVNNPNVVPFSYQDPHGVKQVVLELNYSNSYLVEGTINGKGVTFVVDTGASTVSIPKRIATFLDLKPQGRASHARTANGLVEVYSTSLDKLTVGNIELSRVPGMINMGDTSEQILLGMSALKMLDFRFSQGKLVLTQRPE